MRIPFRAKLQPRNFGCKRRKTNTEEPAFTQTKSAYRKLKFFRPINHSMDSIVFAVSNKIFFDFVNFNKLAIPGDFSYHAILDHIIQTIQTVLETHSTFEMHVSLYSFRVSSLKRHAEFIKMFSERKELYETSFTELHIYYTPTIIDSIMKLFSRIFKNPFRPKIVYHSKTDSGQHLHALFSMTPILEEKIEDILNETS